MQASEIRELSEGDIRARIDELERERFNLKFRSATQTLDDPLRLRMIRKDVARLKTVLRERELGVQVTRAADAGEGAAAAPAAKRVAKKRAAKKAPKAAAKRGAAKGGTKAAAKGAARKAGAEKGAKSAAKKSAPKARTTESKKARTAAPKARKQER